MSWKNPSKFRNIRSRFFTKENTFTDLRVTDDTIEGALCSASLMFLAVTWKTSTGGSVGILSYDDVGKTQKQTPLIHAHSAQVNDLAWSPFHEWTLATASSDATVKVFKLPEGGLKSDLSEATKVLSGHTKRVNSLCWNPTSEAVIATTSLDGTSRVFDVISGTEKLKSELDDEIYHSAWNRNGSTLALTCKDKKLRLLDPRGKNVVKEADSHKGLKTSKVTWMDNLGQKIFTTGLNSTRSREFMIWDERNLVKPLKSNNVSTGSGALIPLYDYDSKIMVLTGRGDSVIRIYEMKEDKPFFTELPGISSDKPHKGVCLLPKRGVSVMRAEIMRLFKAMPTEVQPIEMKVPRKDYTIFHSDLYPDTASSEPALSSQDWFGGKTSEPKLESMAPKGVPATTPQSATTGSKASPSASPTVRKSASGSPSAFKTKRPMTKTLKIGADQDPEDVEDDDDYYEPKKLNIVRASHFRHIFGKPFHKRNCYDNLRVLNQAIHSNSIRCNAKRFAMPWKGTGGPLGVFKYSETGRLPSTKVTTLETGSEIYDFDLSNFHDDLIAVGCENGHIKIFKAPDDLLKRKENFTDTVGDFIGHNHKIVTVDFHPLADNLLVSSSGDLTAKIWNIESGKDVLTFGGFQDVMCSSSWNEEGSLMATSCKDSKLRIFDPRQQKVAIEGEDVPGPKGTFVTWLGDSSQIISSGFTKTSKREIHLFDSKKLGDPLSVTNLGPGGVALQPFYDSSTGVLLVYGKGEGGLKFLEVNDKDPFVHYLTEFSTSVPQIGVCVMNKKCLKVKEVEFMRVLKLTKNTVEPISFHVPRQRKEFFQDDVFPPVVDSSVPTYSASEWLGGSTKKPKRVSLQPEGMKPLSEAPKIVRKVRKYNPEEDEDFDSEKFKNRVLDKFHEKMQDYKEGDGKPLPGDDLSGCDSDEWD